jgi:hypothetical protein
MVPDLNGLEFDTACGKWRTHYIGQPQENSDNIDYYIRFKWVDPHEPENRATPERRLRLLLRHTQAATDDFFQRLRWTMAMWLDSDEMDMVFDYDNRSFLPRDRS